MGTQIGVLTPQQLPTNAIIVGYDKKLQMKTLVDDIYSKLVSTVLKRKIFQMVSK